MMKVGVIGVQGAVSEHLDMVRQCNAEPLWIRKASDLDNVSALILPGGESTTISRLMVESNIFEKVRELGIGGLPVYGTCAGLVLLAKEGDQQVEKTNQKLLALMDMKICRNAFGSQRDSFESELSFEGIGKFPAVFIRAPTIEKVWGNCKPLAFYDKKTVAAVQDNLLVTSFHPELTNDKRIHEFFLDFVR